VDGVVFLVTFQTGRRSYFVPLSGSPVVAWRPRMGVYDEFSPTWGEMVTVWPQGVDSLGVLFTRWVGDVSGVTLRQATVYEYPPSGGSPSLGGIPTGAPNPPSVLAGSSDVL
jgi:hypothetical protein